MQRRRRRRRGKRFCSAQRPQGKWSPVAHSRGRQAELEQWFRMATARPQWSRRRDGMATKRHGDGPLWCSSRRQRNSAGAGRGLEPLYVCARGRRQRGAALQKRQPSHSCRSRAICNHGEQALLLAQAPPYVVGYRSFGKVPGQSTRAPSTLCNLFVFLTPLPARSHTHAQEPVLSPNAAGSLSNLLPLVRRRALLLLLSVRRRGVSPTFFCFLRLMLSHTNVAFPALTSPPSPHLPLALPSPQAPTHALELLRDRTPPSAAASSVERLCPHVLTRDAARLKKVAAHCPMGHRRPNFVH
ncbi:hypothetical protein K458DRAFT_39764 [Lentithecium fluviatile CBS 122367]|uniref:Uncharacterized protein n=1 Tax=Lentithecium fluviatile CBS 122367 TaxID=1168545 RepID=A0A6G1IZT3_9PLEO|nr:hypothetical protein K458DRAFT_39764 [Lentithecium fluviatile CBS 122367]